MIHYYRIALVLSAIGGWMSLSVAHAQQPDPNSPRYKGVIALRGFLASEGEDALKKKRRRDKRPNPEPRTPNPEPLIPVYHVRST